MRRLFNVLGAAALVAGLVIAGLYDVSAQQEGGAGHDSASVLYGEVYAEANGSATTINTQNAYEQVTAGATSGSLRGWTHSGGTLTAAANTSGEHQLFASITASGAASDILGFTIFLNGVTKTNCHTTRKLSAGGDVGAIPISCILDVTASDGVQLRVRNESDTDDVTVPDFNISLRKL